MYGASRENLLDFFLAVVIIWSPISSVREYMATRPYPICVLSVKEPCIHGKRALYTWQKSPILCVSSLQKSHLYMAKEPCMHTRQMSAKCLAKEPYIYTRQKNLILCVHSPQKSPVCMTKEPYIRTRQTSLKYMAKVPCKCYTAKKPYLMCM